MADDGPVPGPIMVTTTPTRERATLLGLCPRCGGQTLFAGWIRLAPRCRACGLDFDAFNIGDGAAAFLILIVGAIICVAAVMTELKLAPPWWVHLVWIPLTLGLTLGGLRLGKGLLMFQEYRHDAGEGQQVR